MNFCEKPPKTLLELSLEITRAGYIKKLENSGYLSPETYVYSYSDTRNHDKMIISYLRNGCASASFSDSTLLLTKFGEDFTSIIVKEGLKTRSRTLKNRQTSLDEVFEVTRELLDENLYNTIKRLE